MRRAAGHRTGPQRPIRPAGWRDSEPGVTDVLGAILLVGLTVVMAVGLGLLLLNFDGPVRTTRAELSVLVDPGADGWGSGDETIRILHRGGDALDADATEVRLDLGSGATSLSGVAQLASVFADGRLTIGELWQHPATIQEGQSVRVTVVSRGGDAGVLLADAAIIASQTTSTQPCSGDNLPPTVVLWTQTPGLVTALTPGSITVRAQLTDDCWGVNQGVLPRLFWRVSPRDTAYADVATTSIGIATYEAVIPAQSWSTLVGQSLQYYLSPVADLGGNSGATAIRSSVILSDCTSDVSPPSLVSLVQSPADVRSITATGVTVTARFADDCAGMASTAPHLFFRINDGGNPGYTDATPSGMTPLGNNTWQGTIPAPGLTWVSAVGHVLEYYVQGQADTNGNIGTTPLRSDVIDLLATYTQVTSNTPTVGTVTSFANAQSWTDSGAAATLAEGGTAGSPTTQVYNANGVINANGWSTATAGNLGSSDDAYASFSAGNPTATNDLQVALANPASSQGSITRVIISAEVSILNDPNDQFQLRACLAGGTCTAYGPAASVGSTDTTLTYEITSLRPGGGTWSWADITNLEGVVSLVQQGGNSGTWRVDRVWAEVSFITTTHSMNIRLDWTGVPAGGTQALDLRYSVTGDTFNVQVWNFLTSTWRTCTGTLTSTSLATYSCTLGLNEWSLGQVRVRFTDVTPTGQAQGNLNLDYARVMTT